MSVTQVLLSSESTSDVIKTRRREILGLNGKLWRLALVAGIAQLSVSIWTWQFAIFLDAYLTPLDIGLIFTIGTVASLLGYPVSGIIADIMGRKKTMMLAFIPLCLGLFMLFLLPTWPFVITSYALTQFGWSFILVISRAMPADEIANEHYVDSTRKFTMVLLPAFIVDGLSPIIAVSLLQSGASMNYLLLIGAIAGIFALILTVLIVQETQHPEIRMKALQEPKISIGQLGRKFWVFTGGMVGYYLAWGLAIPYLGPLSIDDWNIDVSTYGLTWSAFSLSTVILMYSLSSFADRGRRRALILSLIANAVIMILFGTGSGVVMMFSLNIVWAAPIVIWIGVERSLAIDGVPNQLKGRALGTYQTITSATSLIATPAGAVIWEFTSSLRFLWIISGLLALCSVFLIYWTIYRRPKPSGASTIKKKSKIVFVNANN
ncbi:MFS transporter [Candidatus Thorarchaeota archaeon]|nr:MAG: MFS transporter [Candidatus Thorarchaeota archaeon]